MPALPDTGDKTAPKSNTTSLPRAHCVSVWGRLDKLLAVTRGHDHAVLTLSSALHIR